MSKSANKPSTASLSGTKTPVVSIHKIEHKGNETILYNDSARNIFLIPLRCTGDEDPQSQGKIDKSRVVMIKKKDTKTVCSSNFDLNERGSSSQIYILFRAGDADNIDDFLKELNNKQRKGVTLEEGEKFRLHSYLSNRNLRLKCPEDPVTGSGSVGQQGGTEIDDGQQVSEKDKKGETNTQSNQCPELNSLTTKLEALKKEVEALQKDMKLLKSHFKSIAEGLMKFHDSSSK